MSKVAPKLGLGVVLDSIGTDTLAALGGGVLGTAYTEDGPGPGHGVSTDEQSSWDPQVSQAQSEDLALYTVRGGFPGRDGASVIVMSTPEGIGWDEPVVVTDWTAPAEAWGAAQVWTAFAATVIAKTGVIVVAGTDASNADRIWTYNPRSGVWATSSPFFALRSPLGLAYDTEKSRLILWSGRSALSTATGQLAYYSDDGGTTWASYARSFAPGQTGDADGAWRVVTHPTGDWLCMLIDEQDGSGVSTHLASSDRGVNWELVTSDTGGAPSDGTGAWPVLGPSGFVVVYIDSSTNDLVCKVIPSARSSINDAAQVVINDDRNYSVCWACTDYDGIVYAYALGTSGASQKDACWAFRSLDGGATWEQYLWGVWDMSSQTRFPEVHGVVPSIGRIFLAHTQMGDTGTDGTLALTALGGWSDVPMGPGTDDVERVSRTAWGFHTGGGLDTWGALWLPWAPPEDIGWTRTTATGTRTFSVSFGDAGLELTTTAGQGETYVNSYGTNADYMTGEAIVRIASSGSADLATIGTTNTGVFLQPALRDNGVYGYSPWIDIATDGIQVKDGTTIRAQVDDIDCTAQPVYIKFQLNKGEFWVWYKLDVGSNWIPLAAGVTVTDAGAGAATDDRMIWGQETTAVGHAVWRMVAASTSGDVQESVATAAELGDTSAIDVQGNQFGKSLPGKGWAYPMPDGTSSSENLALLSASGGPTHLNERVDIDVLYQYGIRHVHPIESPSPRKPWRATGTSADVKLVYDQGSGQETWYGGALALIALRADFQTAALATDDGAGGITTLGTLDKGWGSINYTRTGRTIVPRSGTATIPRYLHEGELVGGYVIMVTAGDPVARRISKQSAGFWTTDAGVQRVRIELEDVDGTETASGAGTIVHHSGVLVAYPTADTPRRYVRILIDADQVVPDGAYAAGILSVARVVSVSTIKPAWNNSVQHQFQRSIRRRADGMPSSRKRGPKKRIVSYGWDPELLLEMRTLTLAPDYVGVETGVALGSKMDAWTSPLGLLEHALDSGDVPCVLIPQLPASTSTLTDPTTYVYGLCTTEGMTLTQSAGQEGTDEALQGVGLTVESIE